MFSVFTDQYTEKIKNTFLKPLLHKLVYKLDIYTVISGKPGYGCKSPILFFLSIDGDRAGTCYPAEDYVQTSLRVSAHQQSKRSYLWALVWTSLQQPTGGCCRRRKQAKPFITALCQNFTVSVCRSCTGWAEFYLILCCFWSLYTHRLSNYCCGKRFNITLLSPGRLLGSQIAVLNNIRQSTGEVNLNTVNTFSCH